MHNLIAVYTHSSHIMRMQLFWC